MKGVLLDTDTISYFFRGMRSVKEKRTISTIWGNAKYERYHLL